tara:strand:- start:206 stop:559 length:354 start_codon:yes stop_codon:yes gene_type:complete
MKFTNIINKLRRKPKVADTSNYTVEQVEQMVSRYTADPTRATVDALAEEFGKSVRSVIAKLSREGVYIAQQRQTKAGKPVVRKSDLVAMLETKFEVELPTLVKASKADLELLLEAIQ